MTSLLLAASNGAGMGHLTRQAAVALAASPDHHATLFSLSPALPLAAGLGVPGEYCRSYDLPGIADRDWHAYLRDRLIAIVEETGSDAVLFDGVAPYPGIGQAASHLRDTAFVWIRRGMWQPGAGKARRRKRPLFDLVIEPGDFARRADRGHTARLSDAVRVGPISILEVIPPLPRAEARAELGLPSDSLIALVTLGSGRLGDVAGPGRAAVSTLLGETPDWRVAVARSPVAVNDVPTPRTSRLTELAGAYPLARYLKAFDLAISSAGYNAVHELIPTGVPTLFVANTSTRTDDQVARARELDRVGLARWAADDDLNRLEDSLRSLLEDSSRAALCAAMAGLPPLSGASETVSAVTGFTAGFDAKRKRSAELLGAGAQRAKDAAIAFMGEETTAIVKRWLGRRPSPAPGKVPVKVMDRVSPPEGQSPLPLALIDGVSADDLRTAGVVEHILAGASEGYLSRRRRIVDDYYDVVG